jgi:ferredoxin
MPIKLVRTIFFSPTRTTARIVEGIAQGTRLPAAEPLDLTPPEMGTRRLAEMRDALAIIGAPVYGGRIAAEAARRLRRLRARETPAGIVVVYGNRAYEDALLELRDVATEQGFIPIAAAAFIGEHSYSTEAMPIADGRPDALDLAQAQEFGAMIRSKLAETHALLRRSPLQAPGSYPYREWIPPTDVSPITDQALCVKCSDCARACPTAAIVVGEVVATDPASCILCTACVKKCPTGARKWEHPRIMRSREWLSTNCRERKSPEFYM